MPFFSKMLAIVVRPTRWPTLWSAPWIRVYPHPRFSRAHSNDQVSDDLHDPWSARGAKLVCPLLCNELPVPAKDGVGSDERCHIGEGTSPDGFATHGEPSALRIGQPKTFSPELLLEDAVLLSEILDDRILLTSNPTGHRGYEDLPRLDRRHPRIVAALPADQQLST